MPKFSLLFHLRPTLTTLKDEEEHTWSSSFGTGRHDRQLPLIDAQQSLELLPEQCATTTVRVVDVADDRLGQFVQSAVEGGNVALPVGRRQQTQL